MKLNNSIFTLKTVSISLIGLLLLSSCATKQGEVSPKKPIDVKPHKTTDKPRTANATASALIKKAESATSSEAILLLLQASELYLMEKNPSQALWLSNQVSKLLHQEATLSQQTLTNYPNIKLRALSIKAQSLYTLNELQQCEKTLDNIKKFSDESALELSISYYELSSAIKEKQQMYVDSLNAMLWAIYKSESNISNEKILAVWQKISMLADWQLSQLVKLDPPNIKGWQQLSLAARQFGSKPTLFKRYLSQWQNKYPDHQATLIVNTLLTQQTDDVAKQNLHNIAVILPLSGNQATAGEVLQQGILAAYQNQDDDNEQANIAKTIHFIDSLTLDWQSLPEQLSQLNVDYVIGPLLRDNVDKYLALTTITTPTLLLNLPATNTLMPHQIALSMRPEDEAVQAASSLARLKYKHPIVLSHDDNVSQRVAQAFAQQWQIQTGQKIDVIYFEESKDMQASISDNLEVTASKQRIKEVDSKVKQTIKFEPRNRRDIDMIYVVGSPTQTRLLKPYIDVNIAPFAKLIPIYASSRSHSVKIDNSNTRDLEGLTFTEIPWLLPSKQQNKPLADFSRTLFPERSDSLQRIFAMGFDSLALIEKLAIMKQANYVRHYGQTGVLQLNSDNILTRSLLWGRYQDGKDQSNTVLQVALE